MTAPVPSPDRIAALRDDMADILHGESCRSCNDRFCPVRTIAKLRADALLPLITQALTDAHLFVGGLPEVGADRVRCAEEEKGRSCSMNCRECLPPWIAPTGGQP